MRTSDHPSAIRVRASIGEVPHSEPITTSEAKRRAGAIVEEVGGDRLVERVAQLRAMSAKATNKSKRGRDYAYLLRGAVEELLRRETAHDAPATPTSSDWPEWQAFPKSGETALDFVVRLNEERRESLRSSAVRAAEAQSLEAVATEVERIAESMLRERVFGTPNRSGSSFFEVEDTVLDSKAGGVPFGPSARWSRIGRFIMNRWSEATEDPFNRPAYEKAVPHIRDAIVRALDSDTPSQVGDYLRGLVAAGKLTRSELDGVGGNAISENALRHIRELCKEGDLGPTLR